MLVLGRYDKDSQVDLWITLFMKFVQAVTNKKIAQERHF
ncbi:hypothetical protein F652_3859 [Enterobacteriaceae bacterium bta3-1]|nr:hypothetical protein F652_3859 [Enterobacteriaceae bacterium bta3-1]